MHQHSGVSIGREGGAPPERAGMTSENSPRRSARPGPSREHLELPDGQERPSPPECRGPALPVGGSPPGAKVSEISSRSTPSEGPPRGEPVERRVVRGEVEGSGADSRRPPPTRGGDATLRGVRTGTSPPKPGCRTLRAHSAIPRDRVLALPSEAPRKVFPCSSDVPGR